VRSKHTLGFLLFSVFLLAESALTRYYYLIDSDLSLVQHADAGRRLAGDDGVSRPAGYRSGLSDLGHLGLTAALTIPETWPAGRAGTTASNTPAPEVVPVSPNRRQFLAAGATAGLLTLSGCLDALGDDGDRRLQLVLSEAATPLRSGYVVDFADTERPNDDEAFAAALAGESYTTRGRTPFGTRPDDPKYARHEGTYYRLGSVVVNERAVTHPVVRLSKVTDAGASDAPDAAVAETFSEADQRAVHVAHMAARARDNEGGAPWGVVRRGGYVFRDDGATAESRLVGADAPSHVIYHDTVYELDVRRERFHEPVYRATVDPVAESPERLEAILRAKFVDARLSGGDLSAEARSILRDAQAEGYAESHPYTEPYRTVLTELGARAYLDGNVQKDAYVEDPGAGMTLYDGTYYRYRLRFRTR